MDRQMILNSHCTSCISPDKYLENGNCITKNIDTTNKIVDSSTKDVAKILKSDITTDMMKDITIYVENIILIFLLYIMQQIIQRYMI